MTLEQLALAVQKGDRDEVRSLVSQALNAGLTPAKILDEGLIAALDVVGERFQRGEIYIPHMLLAARAMHTALDILQPLLAKGDVAPAGKVVLGTVQGDHHDIGKNLVAMMLKGKGFEVVDIGIDASPSRFLEAIDEGVHIVAMSALLSTTVPAMAKTIEALEQTGLRSKVKVMVGGGVITQELADRIGADAYGPDAAAAATLAVTLINQRTPQAGAPRA